MGLMANLLTRSKQVCCYPEKLWLFESAGDSSALNEPQCRRIICLRTLMDVLFWLLAGNTGGVFGIVAPTGLIFIARALDLTSVGFYTLTVRVTDSGFPPLMATATVRISLMLSDYSSPKFAQKEYQAEVL